MREHKAGQTLSVFNFGSTAIESAAWLQSQGSIDKEVRSIIEMLNPSMRDLLDMNGSDTELRGKVRYAKLGLSDKKPYRWELHSPWGRMNGYYRCTATWASSPADKCHYPACSCNGRAAPKGIVKDGKEAFTSAAANTPFAG